MSEKIEMWPAPEVGGTFTSKHTGVTRTIVAVSATEAWSIRSAKDAPVLFDNILNGMCAVATVAEWDYTPPTAKVTQTARVEVEEKKRWPVPEIGGIFTHRHADGGARIVVSVTETEVRCLYDDGRIGLFCRISNGMCEAVSVDAWGYTPPVSRVEAPCPSCKRANDVGVKTCWCCGGTL